ncbi:MAG TPA: hypothetical protein VHU87_08185 [Rhizomicrobium sp.]|jgi:hypothetical protein|nr:hypothetical protein [Rhizomicrobium sp.]
MRRRLWMLSFAALSGAFASFFVVNENYVYGAVLGAFAGMFVLVFIRAWPHDLDPRERNGKLTIHVTVDGKNIAQSRYSKRSRP